MSEKEHRRARESFESQAGLEEALRQEFGGDRSAARGVMGHDLLDISRTLRKKIRLDTPRKDRTLGVDQALLGNDEAFDDWRDD